jgi:DNA helicase-2/ATP-dependent DNA helicase PcrA
MMELDRRQRQAVESNADLVIVSGGPGTGKTFVLTRRFQRLVTVGRVPLSSILLLTFSSAAAARLRRVIEALVGTSYDEAPIHTFHSFAANVLNEHYSISASSAQPVYLSPFKEYLVIKELLGQHDIRYESELGTVAHKDGLAREVSDFIGLLKQNRIGDIDLEKAAKKLTPRLRDLARLYSSYEKLLKQNNWVGLRDAVAHLVDLFESDPESLRRWREKFVHILVDEFQETDPAQFRLLTLLASGPASLFVAGDENQRIFRFRGSMTGQFSEISKTKKKADVFELEENHRLPSMVQAASSNLIGFNHGAGETAPVTCGTDVVITQYEDSIEQAYGIARQILRIVSGADAPSARYSDFAVLCRSASRSAFALEEAFRYYRIPYVSFSSASFYKHPMVRSTADFLKLLVNPDDDRLLLRVLGIPAFGIDSIGLRRLVNQLEAEHVHGLYRVLKDALLTGTTLKIGEDVRQALTEFIRYFEEVREAAAKTKCPSGILQSVMRRLFYGDIVTSKDRPAGVRDARNLRLLYDVVTEIEEVFGGLRGRYALTEIAEYMEHAFAHFASERENDPADECGDGVRLMTIHQAKGLEFPFVFLVDFTDEHFPSLGRSSGLLDGASLGRLSSAFSSAAASLPLLLTPEQQLKEERHLAYVAVTRPSRRLAVSFTKESSFSEQAEPSPFLDEMVGELSPPASETAAWPMKAEDLIRSSFVAHEIESNLRACVRPLDRRVRMNLFDFLVSLGLDADFICSENPFEPEPKTPLNLAGHVYSASQLSSYLSCPRKFFFENLLRIVPERPEDFGLGQLIHRVLEDFHREVKTLRHDDKTLEAKLLSIFMRIWRGDAQAGEKPFFRQFPTALPRAAIERRAQEILTRYLRTELAQASGREVLACEQLVSFSVGEYPFRAKIDRIDSSPNGAVVIDYKTSGQGVQGAASIKKKFLNLDGKPDYAPQDFQLPLYLLAARNLGHTVAQLTYYWLAQEDSREMFKKGLLEVGGGVAELSDEEMNTVEETIKAVVSQIESGVFSPNPKTAYHCTTCSFDLVCDSCERDTHDDV